MDLLLDWCRARVRPGRCTLIGLHGPQGAGKSTLAAALVSALAPLRVVAISIDDFYLSNADQRVLATSGHPCWQARGYPGTHDVSLGTQTLSSLKDRRPTWIPRYDKSAFGGQGDHHPPAAWSAVEQADLVILEGWCLGFVPVATPLPLLQGPNEALRAYTAWLELLEGLILLKAPTLEQIVAWRMEAERVRRLRGEGAMSEEDCRAYARSFLPAYQAWLPGLWARPPVRPALGIELDAGRHFVKVEPISSEG
ncbi:MAG TPA: hypothetical protein PLA94_05855 [Myxococcota bacterium]|nr:hypothetical protein [Myxococcota bacterium]